MDSEMSAVHPLLQPADAVPVMVIGAGLMGAGIAQVAAQAGHPVTLHDARPGAAEEACQRLAATFETLAAKGKLSAEAARAATARLRPAQGLGDAAGAALVVEAIIERLDAKQLLLRELEALVSPACVLASNTSSISITALARGLSHPGRVVGMHFFNPVPLMKLVEVVAGLQTDGAAADAVHTLAGRWGKTAVHARSTPGFIVNRIARPFYAETLALLQEQAATPAHLDACLRGAGFRMGPCELMDLIGHDTNFAVTESVYRANFDDRRFTPSLVQRELVDGGLYGRKSGQGFYDYREGAAGAAVALPAVPQVPPTPGVVTLHGSAAWLDAWAVRLQTQGFEVQRADGGWTGLACGAAQLRLTDGRCAAEVAAVEGLQQLAVFDLPLQAVMGGLASGALAYTTPGDADDGSAAGWLGALGLTPVRLADAPGLVVARTVAMLVNEAADAVQQGVCSAAAADVAMTLGVNYPAGPHAWARAWGSAAVVQVLEQLDRHCRGERYRVSPSLRRACWSAA
jgi:3-hydroxybutyryl-CoA dehydrogenase